MKPFADTSFVVSLYVPDANHARAVAHASKWRASPLLPLTAFGYFETQNVLRRQLPLADAESVLELIRTDIAAGVFEPAGLDPDAWFAVANELSRKHAWTLKPRALDVLHISAALLLNRSEFLTFDKGQAKLAALAGLTVAAL